MARKRSRARMIATRQLRSLMAVGFFFGGRIPGVLATAGTNGESRPCQKGKLGTGPVPVKVLIALVIAWCLLVTAAVAATSTRRFEQWDIYLAGAAVVVGLAIVIAIVLLP
jgi:hypothetical protein